MATRTQIVEKAYKCLDEVYPDNALPSDLEEFRIADFVDEAIRFIGRVAPVRALGQGIDFGSKRPSIPIPDIPLIPSTSVSSDTSVSSELSTQEESVDSIELEINISGDSVILPNGFVRLIAFQMSDWDLPVTDALYSDNPRYRQQADPILRGTPKRPIVFICADGEYLEYYSSAGSIKKARAFVVNSEKDIYPEQLSDVIAWKTAELVLSAMNDTQGVQFVQNQIQQQLQAL